MIKFGTGGFRAIIGDDFNKNNVQKIAQALAMIIKKDKITTPVLIGYDRRFLSDQSSVWFAEVLTGNNIKCLMYNRPVPTPMVMFGVLQNKLDYGVTITASHNPYTYNGVKVCVKGGYDANVELTARIEKLCNSIKKIKTISIDMAKSKNLIEYFDNMKEYLKNISKFVSKEIVDSKIKILYDSMHGATTECMKILAKNYKFKKFTMINDNNDAYFEYKLPSPSEETLSTFKKLVTRDKYSLGLACDGDGDRLGVVDEKGEYYNCNTILAIIYYYLIKYRGLKGDIVINQSTSNILDKLATKFGFKCHQVPVGFKWISAKIKETNALLGGESSGGLTMNGYTPCKDSMFAISLLLDAMANIKKPLSEIVEEVKNFCGYNECYFENNVVIKNKSKLTKALNKQHPAFTQTITKEYDNDGHKYVFEDGSWLHIRFSGTENLLRIFMEFPTLEVCEKNLHIVKQFIEKIEN